MIEGVPCPPEMKDRCPIYQQEGECYQDTHHLYWPSSDYTGKIEKEFRQLEVNKITICRWLHNTLHAVVLPPEKPTLNQIRKTVNE